jgi:putative SOS response-associated peptidase YedK
MPTLYAITTNPAALADLFAADADRAADLPPQYAVLPGHTAPVVRNDAEGQRAIEPMRWGLPDPMGGAEPLTALHDIADPRWRERLIPEYRCLIPATAFCEYAEPGREPHWFARDQARTPFALAGIWMPVTGGTPNNGLQLVFALLTTIPNDVVQPVNAEAMPAIIAEDDWSTWLEGDLDAALALIRPAPSDAVILVATGEERDPPESRMGYQ